MAEGTPTAKLGNVTKPPELRFSKAGKPFVKVNIAVNPYVPQGEPAQEATFYEVTAFGSLAENIAESVHKGHRIVVIGKGSIDKWTGQDGVEKTKKVIIADGFGPDIRFVAYDLHKPGAAGGPQAVEPEPVYAQDEEPF